MNILQLPNPYTALNSTHVTQDITLLRIKETLKLMTLDIKDRHVNLPISETIHITKTLMKLNHT
jgi:hypothetical protein